jgi:hypothetical protein
MAKVMSRNTIHKVDIETAVSFSGPAEPKLNLIPCYYARHTVEMAKVMRKAMIHQVHIETSVTVYLRARRPNAKPHSKQIVCQTNQTRNGKGDEQNHYQSSPI